MAAAAPIAIGLQFAASTFGAIQESKGLKAEARALDENARLEESNGASAAVDAYRASRMQMGEDIVAFSASGGVSEGGSAGDILAAQAIERELEVMNIHYEANNRASGLRAQAKDRRRAAKGALIGGVLGAAAQAISGVSAMRSQARSEAQNQQGRTTQRTGYGMPIPSRGA